MENIQNMKKTDFNLKYNTEQEEWVVVKVKDELTKNHRKLEHIVSGVMPENKTDPMCPVQSYKTYIEHLNPENEYMWQYPLLKINPENPEVWYTKQHLGKNPLSTFMSDLSKLAKLSRIYTNHSIRSTGITVLTNANFSNSDIMSVSGHKSVQSLAIYQKTDQKKKIEMGKALNGSLTPKQNIKKIMPPPERAALPAPENILQITGPAESAVTLKENVNPMNAMVPFEANFEDHDDIPDFDLLSAICDIENAKEEESAKPNMKQNVANCTSNVVNKIPNSFFANCQIGSININFGKK